MATKIKTDPTKTVLIITVGFLVLSLVFPEWKWAAIVALLVGLAGAISAKLSRWIHWLWMELARILSYIIPNILLSIVFYVFLFPFAMLAKLFGRKDPLFIRNKAKSLFQDSNKEFDKASFENPW